MVETTNCVCAFCGKPLHKKPSHLKRAKNHYCSQKCHYEAKKEYMKGEGNHQYGIKGRDNASWKSDTRISNYGYLLERAEDHPLADNHGFVFQHRLVAEQHLLTSDNSFEINGRRYLKKEYHVHHKNFDRTDNRPENLVVMTASEHRSMHCKLNPMDRDSDGRFKKFATDIVKIKKVTDSAIIPKRSSDGAAGYDLSVDTSEPITIKPHETVMVQSNIAFEIPKGYFGAIYARSGISTKRGLRPATCVSVIDSDYRGSVGLPIHNDSEEVRVVQPHERVAQIVFQKALDVDLELVDSLEETDRGDNGFGSTGR